MPIFQLNTKHGLKEIVPFFPNFIVKTEWPLGKRFIDVAILDCYNNPILLIEVLHTHKVCQEKAADIDQYPWIEIKAKSCFRLEQGIFYFYGDNRSAPKH